MDRRASLRGMTLIELMVVVSVIAFLLVAVGPSIGAWMRNLQVRSAAESVQNGLQLARAEAIRRNLTVRFSLVSDTTNACTLSTAGRAWVVSVDDPTSKCAQALSDTSAPRIFATYAAGDGRSAAASSVTFTGRQSNGATAASSVAFDALGRVTSATALARISFDSATASDDVRKLQVRVNAGGNIRLCDPLVTATADPRYCS
jgi:type IV fimbrial biogenesis protein FimT